MTPPPPSPPPDEIRWDALARYFAGEMTDAEAEELDRWIDANPQRGRLVGQLWEIWNEAAAVRPKWNVEAALRRIKETPREAASVIRLATWGREKPIAARPRRLAIGLLIAAAVAVLAGGVGLWQAGFLNRGETEPLAEVATRRGQRANVRFPDGTAVVLGPASTMKYAASFRRRPPEIHLRGEAYFTVTHDQEHSLTVSTGRGIARDVGTRFLVRCYATDSVVDVVVAEGNVFLKSASSANAPRAPGDSLLLAAGDLGRVTTAGRLAAEHGVPLEPYLSWTEGRLVFHDTPLRDAAVQLSRWYDLDVLLADSAVGSKRLTAAFKDEPLPQVLHLIAASLGVRIAQRGRVVTIRSKEKE